MRVRSILRQREVASEPYGGGNKPKFTALAVSCLIHVVVVGTAVLMDPLSRTVRQSSPTLYDQVIAPHEKKIIWYRVRDLPRIDPQHQIGGSAEPRGREKRDDVIISIAPKAEPARQLVIRPDQNKPLPKEIPAPNLVAMEAELQKQKARKSFIPPPIATEQAKPNISAPPDAAAAPRVPAGTNLDSIVKVLPKMRRSFVPPPVAPTTAKVRSDIPDLAAPQPDIRPGLGNAASRALESALAATATHLPNRPFVPPAAGKQSSGRQAALLPEPDSGPGGQFSAAILSTSPLKDLLGPLPEGSRAADLSAAPKVGPRSTGSAGGGGPQLSGLVLQPGHLPTLPVSPGTVAPLYEENRIGATRATLSAPLRPSSRTIPRAIETKFHGRVVYTMVVSMPRLPMYGGDWIMWFGEREGSTGTASQMRAPLPARKFAPLTDHAEQKPTGRVQLSAVILKSGQLDSVELFDRSAGAAKPGAIEDFQQWRFSPALRDGLPIDVEIVIEIPFQ